MSVLPAVILIGLLPISMAAADQQAEQEWSGALLLLTSFGLHDQPEAQSAAGNANE